MKKATITAIVLGLMLAASAAAAARPHTEEVKTKKKREGSGMCTAMVCGVVGGSCDVDETICPRGAMCINGVCTIQTVGSKCIYDGCYASEEDLVCDSDSDTCIKRKGKGEPCKGDVCKINLFCATESRDMEAGVCASYPKKLGDKCTFYHGYHKCPDDLKCLLGVCGTVPNTTGADCDPSDYGCSGEYLYCSSETNKCTEYPKDGEPCYQNYYCNEGHYCTYKDGSRVCKKYLGKDENCTSDSECADGLYCKQSEDGKKTCSKQSGENEPCTPDSKCADGLYCNYSYGAGSGVCTKYPGEGEECYYYNCAKGLYCSNSDVCVKLPGFGEKCYNRNCAEGLVCGRTTNKEYTCWNKVGKEGEYCFESNGVTCEEGLKCDTTRNVCFNGECVYDDECPGDKECLNNKCVDLFTLDKGEECNNVNRPYFCKEGLVCGRSDSSSTGYSCQERKTKLEDNITCDDDDCPSDSKCECNEITGNMQCVPLPYSDRNGLEYINKFNEYIGCEDCDTKIALAYRKAWCIMYTPYDSYCMCLSDYLLPDESSSSSSSSSHFIKSDSASKSYSSSSSTKVNSDESSSSSSSSSEADPASPSTSSHFIKSDSASKSYSSSSSSSSTKVNSDESSSSSSSTKVNSDESSSSSSSTKVNPDESSSSEADPASPSTSSSKTKGNSDTASAIKLSATLTFVAVAAAVMML